jgi:hypothetical protein
MEEIMRIRERRLIREAEMKNYQGFESQASLDAYDMVKQQIEVSMEKLRNLQESPDLQDLSDRIGRLEAVRNDDRALHDRFDRFDAEIKDLRARITSLNGYYDAKLALKWN